MQSTQLPYAPGHWSEKTIETLRKEACEGGQDVAFEAIRVAPHGRRVVLIACIVRPRAAELAEALLPGSKLKDRDWTGMTLTELFAIVVLRGGPKYGYLCLGEPTAVAVICAEPDSITKLEQLLGTPT